MKRRDFYEAFDKTLFTTKEECEKYENEQFNNAFSFSVVLRPDGYWVRESKNDFLCFNSWDETVLHLTRIFGGLGNVTEEQK